jgi:hypothetical protein
VTRAEDARKVIKAVLEDYETALDLLEEVLDPEVMAWVKDHDYSTRVLAFLKERGRLPEPPP